MRTSFPFVPFTASEARSAGVAAKQVRYLCDMGSWRRLRRNAYVASDVADASDPLVVQAKATLLQLAGEPVVSHETAAVIWGIDHLWPPTKDVQFVRWRRSQGRREPVDAVVRHAGLPEPHRTVRNGLPITTPARTVLDIARIRGRRAGVVAADSALHQSLCTRADLVSVVEGMVGWPYVRTARQVIGFADSLAESPLESISRLAFVLNGVPAPRLQATDIVAGYRLDFVWDEARLVGEADGMQKYHGDSAAFFREKQREQALVDAGYSVIRWGWDEAFLRPRKFAERIRRAWQVRLQR